MTTAALRFSSHASLVDKSRGSSVKKKKEKKRREAAHRHKCRQQAKRRCMAGKQNSNSVGIEDGASNPNPAPNPNATALCFRFISSACFLSRLLQEMNGWYKNKKKKKKKKKQFSLGAAA
jgi:hypothetical protein